MNEMKISTVESKIKFLQDCLKEGYTRIKTSRAEEEGFDKNKSEIEIGNFKFSRDNFFGGFDIELINNAYDLDNKPIIDNKKAFTYLQTLIKKGISEISIEDIKDFNIITELSSFAIGNISLSKISMYKNYRIDLLDKNKTSEGKWNDKSVDYKKVIKAIQSFKISESAKSKEVKINNELELHFRKYFENSHKSTGPLTGFFDLVIGKMNFVIEIKMSKALLKASKRNEASGQIKQYLKQFRSNNFMLLVFGPAKDKQDKNLIYLENEITKEYDCFYHYFEIE